MEDALIREINEAVERDRLLNYIKKHQKTFLFGFLALLVAVGGGNYWNQKLMQKRQERADKLIHAIELISQQKFDEAQTQIKSVAAESKGQARVTADIWLAKAYLAGDKADAAKETLKPYAGSHSFREPYAGFACLMYRSLVPVKEAADISCGGDHAFSATASEFDAHQAFIAGKTEEAAKLWQDIVIKPESSFTQKQRLGVLPRPASEAVESK